MKDAETTKLTEQLIGIDDLCHILNLKKSYIYLLTHQRKIPHYKLGGQLRFRLTDIEAWLKSQLIVPKKDLNLVDI